MGHGYETHGTSAPVSNHENESLVSAWKFGIHQGHHTVAHSLIPFFRLWARQLSPIIERKGPVEFAKEKSNDSGKTSIMASGGVNWAEQGQRSSIVFFCTSTPVQVQYWHGIIILRTAGRPSRVGRRAVWNRVTSGGVGGAR